MLILTFIVLVIFSNNANSLLYFHKLELKHQASLMLSQNADSDKWIEQKLDNFHPQDTQIWMQRYFMQSMYDQPSGPVFLSIGGEGPANPIWMENGHWITMAKQFGALCFMLEHRFYGKSHPTNNVSDEHLNYLSSEQALADIANFIANMTNEHQLGNRKWIVFGGSYSGALAVWARLKYPHLVAGAVSASAPLDALVDFSGYLDVVSKALATYGSSTCNDNIAQATSAIAYGLKSSEGRKMLEELFSLCQPLDEGGFDNENFQQAVAGNVMGVVQYNKDNRAFEGGLGADITIETICLTMDNTSLGDPLHRYARFNLISLNAYKENCLDASYSNSIKEMKDTSWSLSVGGRAWMYQTCTEFGWYQASDSLHQPFVGFPLAFTLDLCKSVFGIDPARVADAVMRTNERYGSLHVADVVRNVTLYNGGVDPWHNVSYVAPSTRFPKHRVQLMVKQEAGPGITSMFVPDTAHCAIMYPASPKDSPLLSQARSKVESVVASWL